jgi:hypothetical protein
MEGLLDIFDSLAPGLLWFSAFIVICFTAIVILALSYHWKEYSIDSGKTDRMVKGYLVIAGILITAMILNLIFYLY